jgi:hypothetical protein
VRRRVFGRLDVDRDARERQVLPAMVEVQVRCRDRDDVVGLDRPFPEVRDDGSARSGGRPIRCPIAEPDAGIEEDDAIGMDDA